MATKPTLIDKETVIDRALLQPLLNTVYDGLCAGTSPEAIRTCLGLERNQVVVVDTVADLRAHAQAMDPDLVFLTLGAKEAGDGGGGMWRWDAYSTESDNLGTAVLPTGHTGAGRRKRILDSSYVQVAWWGLDGVDIGPKIQAALDFAAKQSAPQVVQLPAGTHDIKTKVTVKNNGIGLCGVNTGSEPGAISALHIAASFPDNAIEVLYATPGDYSTSPTGVRFKDFSILGNYVNGDNSTGFTVGGYVLYLEGFNNSYVGNVNISRVQGGGIYTKRCIKSIFENLWLNFVGDTGKYVFFAEKDTSVSATEERMQATHLTNISVEHCTGEPLLRLEGDSNAYNSIIAESGALPGTNCQIAELTGFNNAISNLQIQGTYRAGAPALTKPICLIKGRNTVVTNSQFVGDGGTSQLELGDEYVSVSNCNFASGGAGIPAIVINSAGKGNSVKGCVFYKSNGIKSAAEKVSIMDCSFYELGGALDSVIEITGKNSLIKSNNFHMESSVASLATAVIMVDGALYCVADGNYINWTPVNFAKGHGIWFKNSGNGRISNNTIFGAGKHGILVEQKQVDVLNNKVFDVGADGADATSDGIHFTSSVAVLVTLTISNNTVDARARDQIRITDIAGDIIDIPVFRPVLISGNAVATAAITNAKHGNASGSTNVVVGNLK
jgi:parallel beta-helix repeat protein